MTQDDAQESDETLEERALEALRQRMARPQPRASEDADEDSAEASVAEDSAAEESAGAGSATGFVGMLAKRQLDGESTAGAGIEAESARRAYPLQMAREISQTAQTAAVEPGPAKPPLRYRLAVPAAWIMAMLLLLIAAWAIGALLYMHNNNGDSHPAIMSPTDVKYPLITWSYSAGPLGDYTPASRIMAWLMLACMPVAALLMLLAGMVKRRMHDNK